MRGVFSIIVIVTVMVYAGLTLVSPAYAAPSPACEGRTGYCANLAASAFAVGNSAAEAPIPIGDYIEKIYIYLLGLVGIAALIMFIIGGIMYMTARDNASQVGTAKNYLWNAVLGLVLALVSWLLLNTINPDLVKKLAIDLNELEYVPEYQRSFNERKDTLRKVCDQFYQGNDKSECESALINTAYTKIYAKTGVDCSANDQICYENSFSSATCTRINGDKKVCVDRKLLKKIQTEKTTEAAEQSQTGTDKGVVEGTSIGYPCGGATDTITCQTVVIRTGWPFADKKVAGQCVIPQKQKNYQCQRK